MAEKQDDVRRVTLKYKPPSLSSRLVAIPMIMLVDTLMDVWYLATRFRARGHDEYGDALVTVTAAIAALIYFGGLAYGVTYILATWERELVAVISHPLFVVPAAFAGILLFRLRCVNPFVYGSVEILVSLIALWFAIKEPSASFLLKMIAILGGIYIMVRGLDNIDRSFSPEGVVRPIWDRFFRTRQ